uniref:Ovule protein n=1 Tax=Parascaris univalens TaxID=6257 RepID=A0A915AX60_PARUN
SSSASSKNAISPITSPIIGNVSFVAESQHLGQCSLHSELSHRGIRGAVGGHIPLTSTFRKGNEATKASGVRRATTAGCDIFTEHRLLSKKFYLCDYSRQPISELSEDRRQTWRDVSRFPSKETETVEYFSY